MKVDKIRTLKAELKRAFALRLDAVKDARSLNELQRSLADDTTFRDAMTRLMASEDPGMSLTQEPQLLHRLMEKGAARWRELIAAGGGACTVEEVARVTGMSADAVRKAAQRRQLLAYREGTRPMFPACQFEHGRVLDGLRELAMQLPPGLSDRAVVSFFLSPPGTQESARSPIERLRAGDPAEIEQARQAARLYLEQAAT